VRSNKTVNILTISLITGIVFLKFSLSFAYKAIHNEKSSPFSLKQIFNGTDYTSEHTFAYLQKWAQHPFLTRSAIKLFEDYKGRDVFTHLYQ